jgi:hypothetical protein
LVRAWGKAAVGTVKGVAVHPPQEVVMTDPEDTVTENPADLAEAPADLLDEFEREVPVETDGADAMEQKLDVPDDGADDYDR